MEDKPETTEEQSEAQDKQDAKPIVRKAVMRMLQCKLTDKEKLQLGQDMAESSANITGLKDGEKEFKTQLKADIAKEESIINSSSSLLRAGYQSRNIQCEEQLDYEAEQYTLVRLDNDEVVTERAMTNQELEQLPLVSEDEIDPDTGEAITEDDAMIGTAIEVIRETQRASTSALQRRLKIGFTRAARLMDILEERGVIGPPNGDEPREILIDLDGPTEEGDDTANAGVPEVEDNDGDEEPSEEEE